MVLAEAVSCLYADQHVVICVHNLFGVQYCEVVCMNAFVWLNSEKVNL